VAVELGLLLLGELTARVTLGASLTCSLENGTARLPPDSDASRIGTNVLLVPKRPVFTSAHSGWFVSVSR